MTLNELFARFDKLAAVRVLGLRGGAKHAEHAVLMAEVGGGVGAGVALKVTGQVCWVIRRVR